MLKALKANATKAKATMAGALLTGSIAVANSSAVTMAGGWDAFGKNVSDWFETGLGGPGLQGVGTAIAIIGIVAAILSFVLHKFNPQSRFPGWFTCIMVAVVGSIAMTGLEKPMAAIATIRDTIFGLIGI